MYRLLDLVYCAPFLFVAAAVEGLALVLLALGVVVGDICRFVLPEIPTQARPYISELCYLWMDLCMFFIFLTFRLRKVVLWPIA